MATNKTFTVTQEGHTNTFTNQTADQVARRLEMMKGGDPMTITVDRPVNTYDIFFVGSCGYGDPKYTQWQGYGSQHRQESGRSHREALLNEQGWTQHSGVARYLVVGPEYEFDSERESIVARLFEITTVEREEDADFTVVSPPEDFGCFTTYDYYGDYDIPRRTHTITGHYVVNEVPA